MVLRALAITWKALGRQVGARKAFLEPNLAPEWPDLALGPPNLARGQPDLAPKLRSECGSAAVLAPKLRLEAGLAAVPVTLSAGAPKPRRDLLHRYVEYITSNIIYSTIEMHISIIILVFMQ